MSGTAPYVVCVGLATLDTILVVPRHPEADERVVASELVLAGGGPAATAAVTLARLQVRVFFVGTVGDDEAGLAVRAGLEAEGVDVSELTTVEGRSPQSAVLVAGGTRAIASFPGRLPALALSERAQRLCREARWVHVDHVGYGGLGALRQDVRLSIDGGNPIDDLDLRGVALYAPTSTMLAAHFPGGIDAALEAGAGIVVVTKGSEGSEAATRAGEHLTASATPVEPISTLGAGDVFHGALLAQLASDTPLADALRFAGTCAALSCRALDGRSAIPTLDELAA